MAVKNDRPHIEVAPATDLNYLRPFFVEQRQCVGRKTPKVPGIVYRIDKAGRVKSNAAWTKDTVTLGNGLVRIAFDVFEHLIRKNIVKGRIRKLERQDIVLWVIG